MRDQSGIEQVRAWIRETLFSRAVVAGFVMLEAAPPDLVAQGEQDMVLAIMPRSEQGTSFGDQPFVSGDIARRHVDRVFRFAHQIHYVLGRFAGGSQLDLLVMRTRNEWRIHQRSQ